MVTVHVEYRIGVEVHTFLMALIHLYWRRKMFWSGGGGGGATS